MEKGKFSQPRPYRDEERQIEETFRQITEKKPSRKRNPLTNTTGNAFPDISEETLHISAEQLLQQASSVPEEEAAVPEEVPIEAAISQSVNAAFQYDPDPACPPPVEEEPEDYEEEPSDFGEFLNGALDFCMTHWKGILLGLCSGIVVMLVILISLLTGGSSQSGSDERILNNVLIAGVNVGGMTQQEAVQAVKNATAHTYAKQDMVVDIAGTVLRLSPKDTNAQLDVQAAVKAAYAYGHTGTKAEQEKAYADSQTRTHTIGLLPYLQLDTKFILETLEAHASGTGSSLTQASYGLEGTYPSLNSESFRPDSAQTLVLTMGTPGIRFDVDKVYDQILDAYSLHVFSVTVSETEPPVEPDPVNIQAIYDEFYVAPVNSRIDMQTFQVIPGSYGYEFDLEAAKTLVAYAKYGEVLRIPMRFIEPELMDENILFQDILSEYQVALGSDGDRINNIRLACQAIDGKTVQPGQAFSFLDTLGEPTGGQGYVTAPVDLGLNSEQLLGGGISQTASALYYCAMLADLEIVSRTSHSFPVDFMDYGMDADIHWGGPDLKFRNSTSYPIQITASVSGSYLNVKLMGTDQRDYFVKMDHEVTNVLEPVTEYVDFPFENAEGYLDGDVIQEGITGYSVKTYKLKYSRTTGQLVSKDYEASTRYNSTVKYVARVAPPETTVPETTVPEIIVPDVTEPEIIVPKETEPVIVTPAATEPVIVLPEETQPDTTIPAETVSETIASQETQPVDQAA